jgi:hypothetical protein
MKKTKYHILITIEKWNIKIVEKDKIDNPNTPRLFVKHLSEFQFLKIPHRQNSSKTIRKIVEIEAKSISPIYIYTTSHYHRYTYTRPPTITDIHIHDLPLSLIYIYTTSHYHRYIYTTSHCHRYTYTRPLILLIQ